MNGRIRGIPFHSRLVPYGDKKVVAQIATCSAPGCKTEIEIHSSKMTKVIPPSMFGEKLRQKGWSVIGIKPYCPEHGLTAKRTEDRSNVITAEEVFKPLPPAINVYEYTPAEPTPPVVVAPAKSVIKKEKPEMNMKVPAPIHDLSQLGEITTNIMDAATKRRIYREIDGNWDDSKGRYLANMTDHLIATKLMVPRAWVEEIRKEVFGDDGSNAEIEELHADLASAEKRFTEIAAEASRRVDAALEMVAKLENCRNEVKDMRQRLERIEVATKARR